MYLAAMHAFNYKEGLITFSDIYIKDYIIQFEFRK